MAKSANFLEGLKFLWLYFVVMKNNTTPVKTYSTEIYIWSAIGHCPLTNRKGSFCDELLKEIVQCDSPASAKIRVQDLLKSVPHASNGYYYVSEYPNQNLRTGWL